MSRKPATNRKTARRLTHLSNQGEARMVDVSRKPVTARRAIASAVVRVQPKTLKLIRAGDMPKGDVLAVARIAGIQAAKKTPDLIPLCHPLPIDSVEIQIRLKPPREVLIEADVLVEARTGVEMEAMTAVSVAALAIYDMCKAVDRTIEIGPIRLEQKSGGRSGDWKRPRSARRKPTRAKPR